MRVTLICNDDRATIIVENYFFAFTMSCVASSEQQKQRNSAQQLSLYDHSRTKDNVPTINSDNRFKTVQLLIIVVLLTHFGQGNASNHTPTSISK